MVREFDLIVVGGGTGRDVVLAAEERGLSVALIEDGPLGGTCHNRGCMPTKMLIHSADIAAEARNGARFGVHTTIDRVDLEAIVTRVFGRLDEERLEREAELHASQLVSWYQREGHFVGPRTMQLGEETIRGERVVIAAGGRPALPPISGLETVPYLTSDEAMRLTELPQRLAIVGGGYVATELAHFFGGLGSEVTIVERMSTLLSREDAEISEWFTRSMAERQRVITGARVTGVASRGGEIELSLEGSSERVLADQLLLAVGRRPNSDRLNLEAAGVELGEGGFIRVDEQLRTSAEGVWAFGDIVGILPLKHVAVRQARNLIRGLFDDDWQPVDYRAIPHSVFSAPQVSAVGQTEEELRAAGVPYKVGRHELRHTAMGMALGENGLAKVLASPRDEILGVHIVGPHASILIQEAVVAMRTGGRLDAIVESVHAHPALPQWLEEAAKAALVAAPEAVAA